MRQQSPVAPTVLVIDDNRATARALGKILAQRGFEPVVFERGTPALDYAGASPTPAAAVVDVHLPDINGLVLAKSLRERFGPRVPIIILSGDTSMQTLNSLPHVGATYFFPKPVNAGSLIDRLHEFLADAGRADDAVPTEQLAEDDQPYAGA